MLLLSKILMRFCITTSKLEGNPETKQTQNIILNTLYVSKSYAENLTLVNNNPIVLNVNKEKLSFIIMSVLKSIILFF